MSKLRQSPPKILLVDDNDVFRGALKATLEGEGFAVTMAPDGKVAKEISGLTDYAAVVSDIRMSPVNGIELLHHIRHTRPVPVILMTGFSELMETQEAATLGAAGFLAKPFKTDELVRMLRGLTSPSSVQGKEPLRENDELLTDENFCRVAIDDFISGNAIKYDIFIRISAEKFVKVAHQGENLSLDRIHAYKGKGLAFLYLKREDFRAYVGFNVFLSQQVAQNERIEKAKKLSLLKHTNEVLLGQMYTDVIDQEIFDYAKTTIETTVGLLGDSGDMTDMLASLHEHSDFLYAHCLGVSLYSVMIAKEMGWTTPNNLFKVAMGGLLHDIGKKEIDRAVLSKARKDLTAEESALLETHPQRGMEILSKIQAVSGDVLQIVLHHHENCIGTGFPAKIKKNYIHPLARLVSVANEFCKFVIADAAGNKMKPLEALARLRLAYAGQLDPAFLDALDRLVNSAEAKRKKAG